MLGKIIFLALYFGLSYLVTLFLYNNQSVFYDEGLIKKPNENVPTYFHKEYDAFARHDQLHFKSLYLHVLLLFWLRFPLCFLECLMFCLYLSYKVANSKIKGQLSKEESLEIKKICALYLPLFMYSSGILVNYKKKECDKVYKKYLGEDYEISYDKDISLYICNHTGFIDMLLGIRYCGVGYIAKEDVKHSFLIGKITQGLQSLFVSRENEKSRSQTLALIEQRQKDYLNGKCFSPLMIFPEGTTSSNRHILTFKKGAFHALLPLKPMLIKNHDTAEYQISAGASNAMINYIRGMTQLYTSIDYFELPVIKPTEYMFEKYKDLGKEKWEIYANVVRNIYAEVGEFELVNYGLRDSNTYYYSILKGEYVGNKYD